MTDTLDFDKAKAHFDKIYLEYAKVMEVPGLSPHWWLAEIKTRYDSGERTQSLYDAMMEVE